MIDIISAVVIAILFILSILVIIALFIITIHGKYLRYKTLFYSTFEVLEKASNRITSEVKSINRVVYDITSKPPATVEWE